MEKEDFSALLIKYADGKCTEEEKALLETWYLRDDKSYTNELTKEQIEDDIKEVYHLLPKPFKHRILFTRIAAAVMALLFIGIYFYSNDFNIEHSKYANDVKAGVNKATLILADGRKVILFDTLKGEIAKETGISIIKTATGGVVYHIEENKQLKNEPLKYNTLITARGEQYQVVLSDGSKVWLNAASSIRFPVTFTNVTERKIKLDGEAYFEISKRKEKSETSGGKGFSNIPFIVVTREQQIEVLGTHFNVNAYGDVPVVKTTLFEGSVKLLAAGNQIFLKPGQQVKLTGNTFSLNPDADLEEAIAWKNGYFKFNENLETIMAKVARWYNVEIVYDKRPDPHLLFEGKISRSKNISALLRIMESTGNVHFKIEGRRILVME